MFAVVRLGMQDHLVSTKTLHVMCGKAGDIAKACKKYECLVYNVQNVPDNYI